MNWKYIGSKVTVNKNFDNAMVHLTALIPVDSSMKSGSIIRAYVRGINAVNMASASNSGGNIFSDNSGKVDNGKYVDTISATAIHTQTVLGTDVEIYVAERKLTSAPSTSYIKVPIILAGTVPYSFELSEISISVDSTEKEILALGAFFADTKEQIVLTYVAKKYLIRTGSILYTITDGVLTAMTETELTASLFQTYGVDDVPDGSLLATLTDPEVLYWHDSTDELPVLSMTVHGTPPLPQVFTSEPMDLTHESISGIDYAVVDASEDVRFAVSFDGGTTWKAFDGAAWFDVSDTAPGMLASTMNAITAEQWAEVVVLDSYMLRFWLPNVTAYVKSVVMHYINP